METVGIRELKTNLSRYLKRVRSGARLLVTARGRAIATISPVEASAESRLAISWQSSCHRPDRSPETGIGTCHTPLGPT